MQKPIRAVKYLEMISLSAKNCPEADCYSYNVPVAVKFILKHEEPEVNFKISNFTWPIKIQRDFSIKYRVALQNIFEVLGEAEEADQ